MTEIIDRVRAVELLTKVVEAKGPYFVYVDGGRGCRYFEDDGSPSCIAGHVLAEVGVKPDGLRPLDCDEPDRKANGWSMNGVDAVGVEIEPEARVVLRIAQQCQDAGEPWGDALRTATEAAGI